MPGVSLADQMKDRAVVIEMGPTGMSPFSIRTASGTLIAGDAPGLLPVGSIAVEMKGPGGFAEASISITAATLRSHAYVYGPGPAALILDIMAADSLDRDRLAELALELQQALICGDSEAAGNATGTN